MNDHSFRPAGPAHALRPVRATRRPRALLALDLAVVAAVLASGLDPHDRVTWLMEIAPLAVLLPILWLTWRRFPLTSILYLGIALQCLGLVAGAAYTFPRVPLGQWIADAFGLGRNPYDRIGHFVQGVVPALAARELLARIGRLRPPRLLAFTTVCVVMTFSACYEIVEWIAAVTVGARAEDFLGMQGDPWDAQADMACAFAGAIFMLRVLPRLHDRQIGRLPRAGAPGGSR